MSDSDDTRDRDFNTEFESPSKRRKIEYEEEDDSTTNLDETHFLNEMEDTIWNFKEGETNVEWVQRIMPYAKPISRKFMFGQVCLIY